MSKKTLTPNQLLQIHEALKYIKSEAPHIEMYHDNCINHIFKIFTNLPDQKMREMLISLLNRGFYKTNYESFAQFLSIQIEKIAKDNATVVFPAKTKTDIKEYRPKSADDLIYASKLMLSRYNKNATVLTTPFFDPNAYAGYVYIAIDDFVGTGNTIMTVFSEQDSDGHKPARKLVASVAAIANTRYELNTSGIALFTENELERVFDSDFQNFDKAEAKEIYAEIAKLSKSDATFRFGYLNSEALAILKRCPDNTLGAFWHDIEISDILYKKMFQR